MMRFTGAHTFGGHAQDQQQSHPHQPGSEFMMGTIGMPGQMPMQGGMPNMLFQTGPPPIPGDCAVNGNSLRGFGEMPSPSMGMGGGPSLGAFGGMEGNTMGMPGWFAGDRENRNPLDGLGGRNPFGTMPLFPEPLPAAGADYQFQFQQQRQPPKSRCKGSAKKKATPSRASRQSNAEFSADGTHFFGDLTHSDINNILLQCSNIDYNPGVTKEMSTRYQYAALMGATEASPFQPYYSKNKAANIFTCQTMHWRLHEPLHRTRAEQWDKLFGADC